MPFFGVAERGAMTVDLERPIFLLGMPRSGTTWLSQIFESAPDFIVRLSPPYSYAYRGRLTEASTRKDWQEVLKGAFASNDTFLTQDWRRETGELAAFNKDLSSVTRLAVKDTRFHRLYRTGMTVLPDAKSIYIIRHPAAALWSWKNCKEFPSDAVFTNEWRRAACRKQEGIGEYWGFDDWLKLSTDYLSAAQAEPLRYMIVRYESLVRNPLEVARRMFEFSGVPLCQQTADFITSSRARFDPRPYSVFKGSLLRESWREEFPKDILLSIENETQAAGLGAYLL